MNKVSIYGIKNCNTMKKSFDWLDRNNIEYTFHDYKKEGVENSIIKDAINKHGWDNVINRRGTTWRKLSEKQKENINTDNAIQIALENPSIIKRPLLVTKDNVHLGFNPSLYKEIFS